MAQLGRRAGLSALLADSVAGAVRTSERGRWLTLAFGIITSLAAASSVATVLWERRTARSRRQARDPG